MKLISFIFIIVDSSYLEKYEKDKLAYDEMLAKAKAKYDEEIVEYLRKNGYGIKDYVMVGKKVVVNGKTYYQNAGYGEGYIYKDEKAFAENTDDVCYIPEHAFDDAEEIEVDGETYYDVEDTYTRKQLEELCKDYFDDEDKPIDVEYLFGELEWTYPQTRLEEFTY